MKEIKMLTLLYADGRQDQARFTFTTQPPYTIEFSHAELGAERFTGEDLFDCLTALREFLAQHDICPLCAGARVDAYPSRMSRQMSGGRKVYIMEMGKPAEQLADIFDAAPPEKVASIDAQREYFQEWVKSLQRSG